VDQINFGGKASQKCRFFDGTVAATNYSNFLISEEKTVAGSASRKSVSDKPIFIG